MSRRPDLWKAELRDREAARKAADAEREPPAEHVCAECGVFGASFGFGCFRNRSEGLWSCADRQCLAIVEARTAVPPMPAEPARTGPPPPDLFSRSAA
ncbi:hypothetical protein [Methylobacterium radiotolerans]|uniref:Uncharacterized protein n=1 Tax=Methylobacterium radiotolerans (strain ATCC 27329 / DSM 1819 / JCM 2831 / NBRC 15690 / NCIMB 10815 / 0-1) TaxID=426355 RepID=B1M2L4_METRJ|nr:hypothetical protein [Methylobacterium radiotolerans]ACB27662.1 hypothetical protein Mrad2831_5717 [Methylobacterium radiotolerans JCM 2831]GEM95896.1 hypothetical protein MRA01_04360 [Methylobacterium radiotolerans]